MRKILMAYFYLVLFFFVSGLSAAEKGHLLIIGGGSRPSEALKEFVLLSKNGPILVITSASGVPRESGPAMVNQLMKAGAKNVNWRHIDNPEMGNADSIVQQIESASAIFFTGGYKTDL